MNRIIKIAAAVTALVLSGCTQSLENTYSNQESRIDSFLESTQKKIYDSAPPEAAEGEEGYDEYMAYLELLDMGLGQITYNRNSNRLTLYPGTGEALSSSGKAVIYYALYTFNGNISAGNLVFTNHEGTATESRWEVTSPSYDPIQVDLTDKNMVKGLKNGLEGVRQGEECYIVFSGKYGYGNKVQGSIPANSALLYHVWVESVL